MKKPLLMLLAVAAMFAAGCKKEINNKLSGPATSNLYLPVTSGSTWMYLINGFTGLDTLTVTMTGGTTVINGKTYYNATSAYKYEGSSTGYFYAANHVYSTRASNGDASESIEIQMLNDTAAVGHSWTTLPTDNGQIGGVSARTINTIEEKNITKVVGGKTFSNVIHTQVDLQYDFGSGFQSYTTYDFYLAKGIGMIETDTSTGGAVIETETILSYTIK